MGNPGAVVNTTFQMPTVDPQIPGAVWWNQLYGYTGAAIAISPGIVGGG
jgi:hypothetical protein